MKKTFNFGKIDYFNDGLKKNLVTVDVELKKNEKGEQCFSAMGNIWKSGKRDILSGGQNLDTIAEYVSSPIFKKIYKYWKLYHLNDIHPECEHQREAGWRELAREKVTIYEWCLDNESNRKSRDAKREAETALKNGETFTPTKEQTFYATLPWSIKTYNDPKTPKYYKSSPFDHSQPTTKTLGWIYPDEYEHGILTKPCPVCGYKYGTSWVHMPIPEEDLIDIENLLKGKMNETI